MEKEITNREVVKTQMKEINETMNREVVKIYNGEKWEEAFGEYELSSSFTLGQGKLSVGTIFREYDFLELYQDGSLWGTANNNCDVIEPPCANYTDEEWKAICEWSASDQNYPPEDDRQEGEMEKLEKLEQEIYDLQNEITKLNIEYEELHYRMEDALDEADEDNKEIERVNAKMKNNQDDYNFITGNYQFIKGKIEGIKEVVNETNGMQRSE
jgi:hypothetical protein